MLRHGIARFSRLSSARRALPLVSSWLSDRIDGVGAQGDLGGKSAVLFAARWGSLVIPAGVPLLVVLFVLAAQLLTNLAASLSTAFVGREWAVAHAATQMAGKGLRFAATAAVLVWAPDIRWVAAVLLVEGATEIVVGAYILIGLRGVLLRRPDRDTLRSYWRYARPLFITSPIGMLQDSLDRVLVARWAG